MFIRFFSAVVTATVSLVAPVAFAQLDTETTPVTLGIGSPAPPLVVGEWVKGKPVNVHDGKVHVVEFWATWCAPCRDTLPYLSQVAKRFAGKVVVTGISVWERDDDIPATVHSYMKTMGSRMAFHVARDDADNIVSHTWLDAAGREEIPVAYIVDKTGRIVWMGHPMEEMEEVLGKVVAGTYSADAAIKKMKQMRDARNAQKQKSDTRLKELDTLFGPALRLASEKKFAEAVAAIDASLAQKPQYKPDVAFVKINFLMMYDEAAAQAYALAAADAEIKNNSRVLGDVAWMIVAPESVLKAPNYPVAVTLAETAISTTTGAKNPLLYDVLSAAYEKVGALDKAITAEQKAIALYPAGSRSRDLADFKARLTVLKATKAASPK